MPQPIDKQLKRRIHGLLARSEVFDNFLQLKFPNLKRVGRIRITNRASAEFLRCSTRWKVGSLCFPL